MSSRKDKKKGTLRSLESNPVGADLSFAGKEAYNLLRTNLMFSLPREGRRARVVGMTSSVHGEGKSLTTVNLAYSLAESGAKVLILECDMRLPSLGEKLGITTSSGLSNILAGMQSQEGVMHANVMTKNLYVILAGDVPPNPSELLGSSQMRVMVEKLGGYFDFILLDLPPIGEVSDALVVSDLTDGVVVVVRQDYSNSADLADTMRQLSYVKARVLGFVFNGARQKVRTYGGYRHYYYNSGQKS